MNSLFMDSSAGISDCQQYRWWLMRVWDRSLPIVAIVGCNPSTADAQVNDPTMRRDIDFAQRFGFGGLCKVNLHAWRTPYPNELLKVADPTGPENDAAILEATANRKIIVTWGACERYAKGRIAAVLKLLAGRELFCLGYTDAGQPRHTLMLPKTTPLIPFVAKETRHV